MKNFIAGIFGIIILFIISPFIYFGSVETIEIKVTEKERITVGNGKNISSKYIIFGEDEVFENTDSFIFFKFNSSDIQNKLKINETYKVKVAGYRINFLSTYRNIISIEQ